MTGPILRVDNLWKAYGTVPVLRGINLAVHSGEVVVLIGPSGCGKSTLLRCLNYLEEPTSGRVWFQGELLGQTEQQNGRAVRLPERALDRQRARMGMVFQRLNLFPHRTVLENVVEGPVVVQKLPRARAEALGAKLLARVGLLAKSDAYPHHLSGGEQQRVAIARALAMEPALLLLDEVTSALDPELADEVLRVIQDLARDGITMVVVTHEMDFAREVASRVVFLKDGIVVEEGPPSIMFCNPQQSRTQEFLQKILRRNTSSVGGR